MKRKMRFSGSKSSRKGRRLVTSAEVLPELIHVYLPAGRMETMDNALELARFCIDTILPILPEMVFHARYPVTKHPELSARDLIHLAADVAPSQFIKLPYPGEIVVWYRGQGRHTPA
jgi:hypothetical protein